VWLAGQLAQRFDHVCVETAEELETHRIAVTLRGTVKLPGNHYRKDDRPELTNPSSYILGANTAAKRAALEREVEGLALSMKAAFDEAEALDLHYQGLERKIEAAKQVAGYPYWSALDHWSLNRYARELEERIADLKAEDVDLQRLEDQRDTAEREFKKAAGVCAETQNRIEREGERQTELADAHELLGRTVHAVADDDSEYLDEVLAGLDVDATVDSMRQVGKALRAELERRRDGADAERRLAHTRIKGAIDRFLEKWHDAAPDNSGDVEQSGAAFVALHDEIANRRLPEAMTKFQQMITEDMVPSIGLLQRSIEKASDEIERRADMVNAGLRRVAFNAGTHLQIAYKGHQSSEVRDFRGHVDTLLKHVPAARRDAQASVAQFRRVRDLMALFTADNAEARRWRANVLDVRNSYTFYGREEDADGTTIFTYHNTASNSGGEQEKLVAFCLAAALSYNLADDDSDGRPRFAPLMLDEAFSKSDETFAAQALSVFEEFGFQLLIAAPIRMSGIVEPFIGQAVLVEKRMTPEGSHSNAASATFGALAARRDAEFDGGIRAAA
jgi:uncharacterized protein YPO0396